MLTPVFLISRKEWDNYCCPVNRSNYILYYNLIPSQEADLLVKKLRKERHCDVFEITGSVNPLKIGKRYLQTVDAFEFISLIRNTDFVVTSSFHGTAFSIIFEKQFFVIGLGKKAGRVESLLNYLKMKDRLVAQTNNIINKDIDYKHLKVTLNSLISFSKEYLRNNFISC